MLNINLKQLEAFVTTVEYSSFTKAAEELFLTQSTVSSHIGALENALGVRLIQRGARQRPRHLPAGQCEDRIGRGSEKRRGNLRKGRHCSADHCTVV